MEMITTTFGTLVSLFPESTNKLDGLMSYASLIDPHVAVEDKKVFIDGSRTKDVTSTLITISVKRDVEVPIAIPISTKGSRMVVTVPVGKVDMADGVFLSDDIKLYTIRKEVAVIKIYLLIVDRSVTATMGITPSDFAFSLDEALAVNNIVRIVESFGELGDGEET